MLPTSYAATGQVVLVGPSMLVMLKSSSSLKIWLLFICYEVTCTAASLFRCLQVFSKAILTVHLEVFLSYMDLCVQNTFPMLTCTRLIFGMSSVGSVDRTESLGHGEGHWRDEAGMGNLFCL